MRLAIETAWTDKPGEAMKVMGRHFMEAPDGETVIIANYRTHTDLPEDAAHSVTGPLFLNWTALWDSVSLDAEHMRWMDGLAEDIEPLITGCYINETDFLRRPHWAKKCFTEANRKRLASIRARHDPEGLFSSPLTADIITA